ncbi:copper resistance CopC family protein [Psychrobacillus soli]|uniref:Copper resistance protein CopC n=1 Tax=Psychrobacillus soli TaxID=1543965 RepID=A0A544TM01_9BACI|nr:copper resistance protein CopC [Psychrobacillus soli]TQR18459.1 copper resistance protein CopC [Psychrobacillus soli]
MKKIILMTIACLLLFSTQAFAHTGLESSNPAQGSTIIEAVNEITLTYMTKIEETSSFKLVNASDESMDVTNLSVNDNVMTGTVETNLKNGPYKIVWKIVGIDGHPIEGEVDFVLNAPIVEEVKEDTATETVEEPEVTEEEPVVEETTSAEVEEDKGSNTGLIIAIVVVLAAAVWFMTRRKNK